MKRLLILLSIWCLLVSCSGLPKVFPIGDTALTDRRPDCGYPYPAGRWQLLHTIEAAFPGGRKSLLMGVTIISADDRSAHCILMTVEGLVLFDARFDREIVIDRGIPPFDSENFAAGLLRDIRLLFFAPQGPLAESGRLQNGAAVCRYQTPDGGYVDMISGGGRRELRRYGPDLRLTRSVNASFRADTRGRASGLPDRLELKTHDSAGYSLVLDLVEAIRLEQQPRP